MPRHVWAKVYCDLLRHPKIIGRPDSDKVLWLGLILYAKEHAPDTGIISGLSPDDFRGQFGIKANLAKVSAGIEYMLSAGLLLRIGNDGLMLKDFRERQRKAGDTLEAHAARQRAYHEKKRRQNQFTDDVRTAPDLTSSDTASDAHRSDAEVEEEKRNVVIAVHDQGRSPPVANLSLEGLTEVDKAQFKALVAKGKNAEATAFLANVRKRSELQDNPRPEAPR
jgi:hypothetical protein